MQFISVFNLPLAEGSIRRCAVRAHLHHVHRGIRVHWRQPGDREARGKQMMKSLLEGRGGGEGGGGEEGCCVALFSRLLTQSHGQMLTCFLLKASLKK